MKPVSGKLNLPAESQSEDYGGEGGRKGLVYSRSVRKDHNDIYRDAPNN